MLYDIPARLAVKLWLWRKVISCAQNSSNCKKLQIISEESAQDAFVYQRSSRVSDPSTVFDKNAFCLRESLWVFHQCVGEICNIS